MKMNQNQKLLLTAAGAGFVGLCLRALLYRIGFDEKGILSASHPLHMICLVLTAAVAVYLAFRAVTFKHRGEAPSPRIRCLLGILAGYFLLIHGLTLARELSGLLSLVRCGLALLSAAAMAAAVLPFLKDRQFHMVCHGLICVCFAVDMLCRYQNWSGNPQLPDYCFHVLACVALSLCAYHRLAFDTDLIQPRMHRFCCLMALYLCLLSLVGPEPWEFYLGGCFWAAVCLDVPVPPAEVPQQEEITDVPA